jgi:hypothetical protein
MVCPVVFEGNKSGLRVTATITKAVSWAGSQMDLQKLLRRSLSNFDVCSFKSHYLCSANQDFSFLAAFICR